MRKTILKEIDEIIEKITKLIDFINMGNRSTDAAATGRQYKLSARSKSELVGVHPDLVIFAHKLISRTPVDFGIIDGVRTNKEQRKLVARGVSKTFNSYHLWGLALDIVPYINGKFTWDDKEAFKAIHDTALEIIEEDNLRIENGFDLWGWDNPHWQMTGFKNVYDVREGGFKNVYYA